MLSYKCTLEPRGNYSPNPAEACPADDDDDDDNDHDEFGNSVEPRTFELL